MSTLMQSVDERTRLAGTNRLEVLLFSLRGHTIPVINLPKYCGIPVEESRAS